MRLESKVKLIKDASVKVDPLKSILIFTDGACSGNPGPGGWGAIIATPDGEIREIAGRSDRTTNNEMEMTAAVEALKKSAKSKCLWCFTRTPLTSFAESHSGFGDG